MRVIVLFTGVILLTAGGSAWGEDDRTQVKLDAARKKYDAAATKFREDAGAYFDKREAAARKDGNKKSLDQVKADRKAFEAAEALPAAAPAALNKARGAAAKELEAAYTAATKEFLKAKKDDLADATDRAAACLREFGQPLPAWGLTFPPGRYNVTYAVGITAVTEVRPNGTFTRVKDGKDKETHHGTAAFTDGKLVCKCEGYVEVWTAADGKFTVEFYWPAANYPDKIDTTGTAVRAK